MSSEKKLIKEIKELKKNKKIMRIVNEKIQEFDSFKNKTNNSWFSELCFCILTANSRANTAVKIQKQVKTKGFLEYSEKKLKKIIKQNKHRFYNNKAKFIVEARKFKNIKTIISKKNELEAREWLVKNIKGIGFKEASHFLRNTGAKNLAILDRHIINLMNEYGLIQKPKKLNKKNYFKIEKKIIQLSKKTNLTPSELDLIMWFKKTRKILK